MILSNIGIQKEKNIKRGVLFNIKPDELIEILKCIPSEKEAFQIDHIHAGNELVKRTIEFSKLYVKIVLGTVK